eukprot:UN25447
MVRLIVNFPGKTFMIYHMVIRRFESFLRICEVKLETLDLCKIRINHVLFHVF